MPKYRHNVTGRVVEVPETYAKVIPALEPVGDDTPTDTTDCVPCGIPSSDPTDTGLFDYSPDYDPYQPDEDSEE